MTIGLDEDKIVAETDIVKANNIITDDLTLTSDILYITDNEENPNILAQFDNSGLRVTDITLYKYYPVDPENPNGEKIVVNRTLSNSMFYDIKGSIDINDDNLIFE